MTAVAVIMIMSLFVQPTTTSRAYHYYSYSEIIQKFRDLNEQFPNVTSVYTMQEKYGVHAATSCDGDCDQIVMEITDSTTLPDETRPEMFLSGEVHGNERVGPQAVTELAAYLLENYDRERSGEQATSWFTRMIKTRNVIIMPTANAYGYYHNSRTEHNVDPNRDFPYDSTANCMKTSAARAINEMYKHHLFRLAITFHSGMEAIAYEWGSYNHFTSHHTSPYSPDDMAQVRIGQKMRLYVVFHREYHSHHPLILIKKKQVRRQIRIDRYVPTRTNERYCVRSTWRHGGLGICSELGHRTQHTM